METYQIDILNPKAFKLLTDIAYLKLISIKRAPENKFMDAVGNLRKKPATFQPPSLEEITKKVELVRKNRYDKKKV